MPATRGDTPIIGRNKYPEPSGEGDAQAVPLTPFLHFKETNHLFTARKQLLLVLFVCGLSAFLIVSFHALTPPPQTRPQIRVNSQSTAFPFDRTDTRRETDSVRFQDTDFYRTIIDNNLFRPLGWTPPRPVAPYRLVGTLVSGATDGVWVSKAIIDVRGEVRVVEIGDFLDAETKVLGIDRHSVLLEAAGKEQVLTLPTGDVLLRGR